MNHLINIGLWVGAVCFIGGPIVFVLIKLLQ